MLNVSSPKKKCCTDSYIVVQIFQGGRGGEVGRKREFEGGEGA